MIGSFFIAIGAASQGILDEPQVAGEAQMFYGDPGDPELAMQYGPDTADEMHYGVP